MLYILPPPRGPSPPSPWDSILCSTGVNTDSQNIADKPPWDSTKLNTRHPPRIRLRTLRLNKANDGFSGVGADEVDTGRSTSLSECYFAGKGTALVLPAEAQKSSRQTEAQGSNIQKHLQSMFYLLRPEETLKMAVKLESVHSSRTRYLVVVSRMGRKAEESCLLGIDCNEKTTVGLVLRVLADTAITLDGDGGFSFAVCGRHHIFKPVSVQAMWSALQTLHKASSKAREENYFQGGLSHDWVDYYERRIESDRSCLNEWHAMGDLESRRPPSPDSVRTKPRERDETEKVIRSTLKEIMMSVDLDEVTSKYIRNRLEEELDMDLGEYKSFIDQEMLTILGQMDAPTEIFDHVYLGSEWNASNYEELKRNGVRHILNVTREIDNFFPGTFDYLNIRVYDDEKTDLLKYWDNTYKYISKAQQEGSKVLVHCKMGVSRSASVVIAYAMKAYNWDFKTAMQHVKEKRTCIKPNTSFVSQLETYQGILDAMKNKEKLQRSKSETNLKSPGDTSERSLPPGSQPTPLLQALSRSALLSTTMSGQDLHQLGDRPKSWSPDNTRAKEILSDKIFPFRSLENLPKGDTLRRHKSLLKLLQKDLVRNVLLPCDNGESYSVSPNQIRHLPGDAERTTATVKQMVNEFESNAKDTRKKLVLNLVAPNDDENSKLSSPVAEEDLASTTTKPTPPMLRAVLVKKEIWDPGEKPPNKVVMVSYPHDNNACDLKFSVNDNIENRTMWTSSTVLQSEDGPNRDAVPFSNNIEVPDKPKDGDPFSNQLDRVFDREERKQQRISTVVPLPQPTPILLSENTNLPSRECPSRQSSWGSYDSAVVLGYQSETRESPSRHSSLGSGDTRTLPSRNSSWGSYDMRFGFPVYYMNEKGEKILHDDSTKKSESPPTFVVEAVNLALVQDNVSSATSSEIDIVNAKSGNFNSCNNRLSVSAPERCSLGSLPQECSLSRSASVGKTDKDSNVIIKAQCHSVKDHKVFRENVGKDSNAIFNKRAEDSIESDHNAGLVRSLKKEFEAKTNHLEIAQNGSSKSKSLPSSPHSVHVEKDRHDLRFIGSDTTREDFSFKKLIGKFEAKENQESLRPQSKAQRFSCIEVSSEKNNPIRVLQTSLISCYEKSLDQTKRPPVAPVVKNPSPNVVVATVITKATMKQQQFGKTHPLARINIKPLYNTM